MLGSGETNELGSGERESGGDENCADSLEAVRERSGVVVVPSSPVLAVKPVTRTSAKHEDKAGHKEDDDDCELEARRPELLLREPERAEDVDEEDQEEEDAAQERTDKGKRLSGRSQTVLPLLT